MNAPASQRRDEIWALITARADLFRHQGAVVESWRTRNGHRFGPYYRLAYREDGRQQSRYLGTDGELANEIRKLLVELQEPAERERKHRRQLRVLRKELARHKAIWGEELAKIGLARKGAEVRGYRTITLARLPDAPYRSDE